MGWLGWVQGKVSKNLSLKPLLFKTFPLMRLVGRGGWKS